MTTSISSHYKSLQNDFSLEIARGNVSGVTKVNKFGRCIDVDAGVDTDIWDAASGTAALWVAPTQARVHNIKSTSTSDDGNPVGVGARTIKIYGLTAWNTPEVSETIIMNGTTAVASSNAYVIIHRMKVTTKGATSVNVGVITATAVTDATVTAQINAGEGQTQMAIYGIPSGVTAYMDAYYASAIKAATSLSVSISLLVNTVPDAELTNFIVKHTNGIATEGTNYVRHVFNPYFSIPGPAIIKIQGNSSTDNTDVSSGFDLVLVAE